MKRSDSIALVYLALFGFAWWNHGFSTASLMGLGAVLGVLWTSSVMVELKERGE